MKADFCDAFEPTSTLVHQLLERGQLIRELLVVTQHHIASHSQVLGLFEDEGVKTLFMTDLRVSKSFVTGLLGKQALCQSFLLLLDLSLVFFVFFI